MTVRDDKLVSRIILDEGITLDKNNNNTIAPHGFLVPLEGFEEVHDFRVFTKVGKILIDIYREKYATELLQTNSYFGVWLDSDKVYFDISENIQDLHEAIIKGVSRNQYAIFDLEANEVIDLCL